MSDNVRKTTIDDIEFLSENARECDVVEVKAFSGYTIREVLQKTPNLLKSSQTLEIDGHLIAVFGVVPNSDLKGVGVIWMLATDKFDEYSAVFAKICKGVVKDMLKGYNYVYNYVHSENKSSIRWLKWLGFSMSEPEPLGIEGANFQLFEYVNV